MLANVWTEFHLRMNSLLKKISCDLKWFALLLFMLRIGFFVLFEFFFLHSLECFWMLFGEQWAFDCNVCYDARKQCVCCALIYFQSFHHLANYNSKRFKFTFLSAPGLAGIESNIAITRQNLICCCFVEFVFLKEITHAMFNYFTWRKLCEHDVYYIPAIRHISPKNSTQIHILEWAYNWVLKWRKKKERNEIHL